MDIKGIESALSLCIKALKILHPDMDENEPCIAYEAYKSAKWALNGIFKNNECETDRKENDENWPEDQCKVCGGFDCICP